MVGVNGDAFFGDADDGYEAWFVHDFDFDDFAGDWVVVKGEFFSFYGDVEFSMVFAVGFFGG